MGYRLHYFVTYDRVTALALSCVELKTEWKEVYRQSRQVLGFPNLSCNVYTKFSMKKFFFFFLR